MYNNLKFIFYFINNYMYINLKYSCLPICIIKLIFTFDSITNCFIIQSINLVVLRAKLV